MDLKIIGKNIRKARLIKAITQSELAERVDLTPNYMSMLERGTHLPKLETLIRLAETLDVPPCELLREPVCVDAEHPNAKSSLFDLLTAEQLHEVREFIKQFL